MISKAQIEDIKNRVDIYEFIAQYADLNKSGQSCCPFLDHDDSTASFSVSRSKQIFSCFGQCKRKGNIYTFVMEYKGVNFYQAVKEVAAYAGIKIKEESQDKLSISIYDLHDKVVKEFDNDIDYFLNRGISQQVCDDFRLGYCDNSTLVYDIIKNEYAPEVINESNLFYENGKCAFHNRHTFPLTDISGNVIGFCGKSTNKKVIPYKNSKDSPVYNKSEFLYGLWQAQTSIKKKNFVIITEGNMDCLAMHTRGLTNTVAVCGTALTHQHTKLLSRYTKRAILFLDGDDAGRTAIYKCYASLINSGFKVWILDTPDNEDPDSLSKEEIIELLKNPYKLLPYMYKTFGANSDTSLIVEYLRKIAKDVKDVDNRDLFIADVAKELNIRPTLIYDKSIMRPITTEKTHIDKEHLLLAGIIADKKILREPFVKKYKFKAKFSKTLLRNVCTVKEESDLFNGLERDEATLMSNLITISNSGFTPQFVVASLQFDEYNDMVRRLIRQIKEEEQIGDNTIILRAEVARLLNAEQ